MANEYFQRLAEPEVEIGSASAGNRSRTATRKPTHLAIDALWQSPQRLLAASVRLTPRSSGAPTAGPQARGGTRNIFASPAASCRRRPLSSNVRHQTPSFRTTLPYEYQNSLLQLRTAHAHNASRSNPSLYLPLPRRQRRTGSIFGAQARIPRSSVTISGESNEYVRIGDEGVDLFQFPPQVRQQFTTQLKATTRTTSLYQ